MRASMAVARKIGAGREDAPEAFAVHLLDQEEHTGNADADDGDGDLGAQPEDGCGDIVWMLLVAT